MVGQSRLETTPAPQGARSMQDAQGSEATRATPGSASESAVSVGMIGLGAMGAPMARNLVAHLPAGSTLTVTARSRERAEAVLASGAQWQPTARGVGLQADAIVVMLPDLPAIEAVFAGPEGLLAGCTERPGDTIIVICSSISPVDMTALAASVERSTSGRVHLADAPVSGGPEGAEAGTLSIMVGASPADAAKVLPILGVCGTAVHLGPVGAGQTAKACNQLVVAATMAAWAEATVLAERSGLDVAQLLDLLAGGYAGSHLLEAKRHALITHDFTPGGMARYMVKDLRGVAAAAQAAGVATPVTDAVRALFDGVVERGLGDRDLAVVQEYVAELSSQLSGSVGAGHSASSEGPVE